MLQAGSQFDYFRPPVLIPRKEVERLTTYKKSRLYAWIKEGTFPRPVRPGRWDAAEVEAWIARQKAERNGNDRNIPKDAGSQTLHGLGVSPLPASISANGQETSRCRSCDLARREILQLFRELGLDVLDKPARIKELERENKKLRQMIAQLAAQTDGRLMLDEQR